MTARPRPLAPSVGRAAPYRGADEGDHVERLKQLPVIGTALRVQERYHADAGDELAASIGFFGFLSLFPLLAVLLALVGLALQGDAAAQQRIVGLVERSIPAFSQIAGGETQVGAAIDYLVENPGNLIGFGTIGLVIAALRIATAAQTVSATVFRYEKPTGLAARRGQVVALAVVGTFALAGAAVAGSVGVDLSNGVGSALSSSLRLGLAFVLDVALFLLAYRLFTPGPGPAWHTLLPGSLLAGAGWTALKLFGTSYITSQASRADSQYGALGSIIGLLILFYLAGRLYVYGAELAALRGHVDDVPSKAEMERDAVRVPVVSPRPESDEAPDATAAAKLAVSSVVLGLAGAVLAKVFRR